MKIPSVSTTHAGTTPRLGQQASGTAILKLTVPKKKPAVPSLKPVEAPVYSTPSPFVKKSKVCEHVWAEAYNSRTGQTYKRCLYCRERIEEPRIKIVKVKL